MNLTHFVMFKTLCTWEKIKRVNFSYPYLDCQTIRFILNLNTKMLGLIMFKVL